MRAEARNRCEYFRAFGVDFIKECVTTVTGDVSLEKIEQKQITDEDDESNH